MGEIKTDKRWLTKTVEGTEAIGDARITIRGKKKWAVKYEVLVDSQEKRVFETKGSFIGVLMDMKKDEHAKEGCELLKTMAEKISDPKRSLTGYYNDRQLQCLAALMEGERTLEEVVEATNLETTQASKALMDLQATGLSYRCEKKGELPRRYTLSTAGKQMTDLLVEYEKCLC